MRFRFHVPLLILALTVGGASVTGCASGGATVSSNPSASDQATIRLNAARVTDGIKTAIEITRAAGKFIDSLPLAAADKNSFDQAIVSVMGTTAKPGPLPAALDALASVTSEASLKATVTTAITALDPLVVKFETNSNLGIAGFGASLRAATLFARNYVTGGVR